MNYPAASNRVSKVIFAFTSYPEGRETSLQAGRLDHTLLLRRSAGVGGLNTIAHLFYTDCFKKVKNYETQVGKNSIKEILINFQYKMS